MNIPDKAVEALAYHRAQRDHDKFARRRIEEQEPLWEQISQEAKDWKARSYMGEAREDLSVAAPFIAAQAWEDGHTTGYDDCATGQTVATRNPYLDPQ